MATKAKKTYIKKTFKKSFIVLKKLWENHQTNLITAEKFFLSHIGRQWCVGFLKLLYERIMLKKSMEEMQIKKSKILKQSILMYMSAKTKKNLRKRRNQRKADSFKSNSFISKSFGILRKYSVKMIKLAINLKQYYSNVRRKKFTQWLNEVINIKLITQSRYKMKKRTKKLAFNELKHNLRVTKALTHLFKISRKSKLFQSFSLIKVYNIVKKMEYEKIIQIESYRRRLFKRRYFKKWMQLIQIKHDRNLLIDNHIKKRGHKIEKLFFEILDIKSQKHKLRNVLIENFMQHWNKTKVKLYFISILAFLMRIKKKRQAYDLVYKKYKLAKKKLTFILLKENVNQENKIEIGLLSKIKIFKKKRLRVLFKELISQTKKINLENTKMRILTKSSKNSLIHSYFTK